MCKFLKNFLSGGNTGSFRVSSRGETDVLSYQIWPLYCMTHFEVPETFSGPKQELKKRQNLI